MARRFVAALSLVVLTLLAACGSDSSPVATEQAAPQRQTVVLTELKFSPPSFSFQVGRPVEITVVNDGKLDHDFTIVGMHATGVRNHTGGHAHTPGEIVGHVRPGERATIAFTPQHTGQFGVRCTVAGHMQSGMIGSVEVF